MQNSFFSVVIATFNRASLLKRALISLINQTETDWEAIIIDDGSTDHTQALMQEFLHLFPHKIRCIKQVNQGAVKAKNEGIALAKGKFITFLDSDDEYRSTHLESRKKILNQHRKLEFLYGGVEIIGNQYVPDRHNHEQLIHLSECVIGGTFFLKKELAISLNGFRSFPIGTDADLFERVKETQIEILKTDLPTYVYRRETEDSITHHFSAKLMRLV